VFATVPHLGRACPGGVGLTTALAVLRSGYVIVGIFTLAAIITPPDAVSMISLAIPMCILYEAGIIAAQIVEKRRHREPVAGAGPE